jgi:hypothetical protein
MVRSTSLMALALGATLMVAAPAEAAKWRGKTRQGRGVSVHTDANGTVSYARLRYIAPCRDRTAVFANVFFVPPFDSATTTSFHDGGPWRFRIGKHTRVKARGSITGGLRRSGRWTGTFRVRLRVYVRGRLDTTCRITRLGWKASPAS